MEILVDILGNFCRSFRCAMYQIQTLEQIYDRTESSWPTRLAQDAAAEERQEMSIPDWITTIILIGVFIWVMTYRIKR
jgi:hypothetical protein